jgi:hypothetical protein
MDGGNRSEIGCERGESLVGRQELSLNVQDLPYNREGKRRESTRLADEVIVARMARDSITLPE